MGSNINDRDTYFAAVDTDNIANVLETKVQDWIKFTASTATYLRMRESWKMYYGLTKDAMHWSSTIREGGPQGEYSMVNVNHYRNFLQHLLVLTTSQRPALECRAANTDSHSLEQCTLGNALLDWYMREKKVERFLKNGVEYALFLSEGFISMDWDPTLGSMYHVDPQTGNPLYEGDIAFHNYTPLDVIRDPYRNDQTLPWCIVIRWKNRFNLAAKYPDMKDDILSVKAEYLWKLREDFFNRLWYSNNDLIPEMTFYHEPCEALPQGRIVKFLSKDIRLVDSPMPWSKVPVFRTSCADQADTPYGYTPGFDLMGPQMALNLLDSVILTNQKTFGVGVLKAPPGANVEYSQLADGLSVLTVNEQNGTLEPVHLPGTPAEIFNYRATMIGDMERLSAVNSVVRGQPDASITSGSFAALIASQAIQFNSGLQMSYAQTCEDVGAMIIEMLQKCAKTERVAKVVGKTNEFCLQNFTSDNISNIKSVVVDIANPLTKTTAGKMKMAEDLQAGGHIKRADQYIMVMETGKLDPEIESERTNLLNIKRENEMLRKGQKPTIMLTDDHHCHIQEHLAIMDDPIARSNPTITGPATEHVMEHIKQWSSLDPNFVQALGRIPLVLQTIPGLPPGLVKDPNTGMAPPMPMPPQGMPMGPGPQAPAPLPENPNISKLKSTAPINPAVLPHGPTMPNNPQTGQKAPMPMGPQVQGMK